MLPNNQRSVVLLQVALCSHPEEDCEKLIAVFWYLGVFYVLLRNVIELAVH